MIFLQFSAAAQTLTVNCNEMDGNRPGQPANWNCYKLSRVPWAFIKLLVYACENVGIFRTLKLSVKRECLKLLKSTFDQTVCQTFYYAINVHKCRSLQHIFFNASAIRPRIRFRYVSLSVRRPFPCFPVPRFQRLRTEFNSNSLPCYRAAPSQSSSS